MNKYVLIGLLVLTAFLSGCAIFSSEVDPYKGMTAEQIFNEGQHYLDGGNYSSAAKTFEVLIRDYPFGQLAERASLDLIYAYYESDDLPSSIAAAMSFIHLYPRSKYVDYAYYMKGVANFSQDRGIFIRYFQGEIAERDPGTMLEAYDDFNELVSRFPKSAYAPDARQRMIYLRNLFAEREYLTGKFYFERGAYVAAANRASYVIKNYQQSPRIQDALVLLAASNRKLQLPAEEVEKILKTNYAV